MSHLDAALAALRAAVDDLIGVAERTRHPWNDPRAPGKWSPAQVIEHVAMALEENANVIAGKPSKIPTLPAMVRPLTKLVFNHIVRTGKFPKARTNRAMTPLRGPATPADARARLHTGLAKLESECGVAATKGGTVTSGAFGVVSVEDFVRFNELHVRHHSKQIPLAL